MTCKKCNSTDIKIVEDRTKWDWSFKTRIIIVLIWLMAVAVSIYLIFVNLIVSIIFMVVCLAVGEVLIMYRSSRRAKSRTKCICIDCGHIWYLN